MTHAAFACATFVLVATAGVAARGEDTRPPKVTVAAPVEQTVTSYFEATGNMAAVNSVDLVARVQGFVEEISYTDGAFVKKGAPLFIIEAELYRVKVERAKSSVSRAQATLTQAAPISWVFPLKSGCSPKAATCIRASSTIRRRWSLSS